MKAACVSSASMCTHGYLEKVSLPLFNYNLNREIGHDEELLAKP